MMRAALDGRKTQTRRVIAPTCRDADGIGILGGCAYNAFDGCDNITDKNGMEHPILPAYQAGDRLMLTSSWALLKIFDDYRPSDLLYDGHLLYVDEGYDYPDLWQPHMGDKPEWAGKTRPAMFATLELAPLFPSTVVKSVRIERLQDISEDDILAEGVRIPTDDGKLVLRLTGNYLPSDYWPCTSLEELQKRKDCEYQLLKGEWCSLWDSINAERNNGQYSWEANPWVWVYEFCEVKEGGAK